MLTGQPKYTDRPVSIITRLARRVETTMYSLINQCAEAILSGIPPDHVSEYDWLLQNLGAIDTSDYRRRYRRFWAMNAAQLSADFYTAYFGALDEARGQAPPLDVLSSRLYDASARRDGGQSLQFSFATKLLHMINPRSAIYDSKVARFYFYEAPPSDRPLKERINTLMAFYDFLNREYARILNSGHLTSAIQVFRQRLNPKAFTDEKIIDSLIWAFVVLLENGGLPNSQVVYR
jgi:hypothetical protein